VNPPESQPPYGLVLGGLAVLHRLDFGMPALIASVRARFVARLGRFDERETNPRLTLWTRTKGSQRCRQTDFQHGISLAAPLVSGP